MASMSSPSRRGRRRVSRSTRTSAAPPRPMTWVSPGRRARPPGRLGLAARRSCRCRRRGARSASGPGPGTAPRPGASPPPMSVAALAGIGRDRVELAELGRAGAPRARPCRTRRSRPCRLGLAASACGRRPGLGPADLADRVGQVDDEHRGQPVDREHELEAGEGERRARPGAAHGPGGRPVSGRCPSAAATRYGGRASGPRGPAGRTRTSGSENAIPTVSAPAATTGPRRDGPDSSAPRPSFAASARRPRLRLSRS